MLEPPAGGLLVSSLGSCSRDEVLMLLRKHKWHRASRWGEKRAKKSIIHRLWLTNHIKGHKTLSSGPDHSCCSFNLHLRVEPAGFHFIWKDRRSTRAGDEYIKLSDLPVASFRKWALLGCASGDWAPEVVESWVSASKNKPINENLVRQSDRQLQS